VRWCEGVFVTVTMAVSTVSVIESIVVMRLCSLQSTTMPPAVRFIAFRLVGRALCVTRPPPATPKPQPRDSGETAVRETDDPDVKESLLGNTEMSNMARRGFSELLDDVRNVLAELRKVRRC